MDFFDYFTEYGGTKVGNLAFYNANNGAKVFVPYFKGNVLSSATDVTVVNGGEVYSLGILEDIPDELLPAWMNADDDGEE